MGVAELVRVRDFGSLTTSATPRLSIEGALAQSSPLVNPGRTREPLYFFTRLAWKGLKLQLSTGQYLRHHDAMDAMGIDIRVSLSGTANRAVDEFIFDRL